jgi:hypothetical protein
MFSISTWVGSVWRDASWARSDFASAETSGVVKGIGSLGTAILRVPFLIGCRWSPAFDAARTG